MMEGLAALASEPAAWIALATLVTMEVVLGVDNLIFISVLSNKLPAHQRVKARQIGIGLALVCGAFGRPFSARGPSLLAGGLFLVGNAPREIPHNTAPPPEADMFDSGAPGIGFTAAIGQITLRDLVFSIDSIITAVGMTDNLAIMVIAVVVAVAVMMFAATPLANFIERNPTVVMLALSFLMLIGTTLIAEGFGAHVPKGYVYAAMAFSALVEGLNILARRRRQAAAGNATIAEN